MQGIVLLLMVGTIAINATSISFNECKEVATGTKLPYPKDCTKFINCLEDVEISECPDKLHFNAALEVCDWPERAGCAEIYKNSIHRRFSGLGNHDKTFENECSSHKFGDRIQHPTACSKFITCIAGGIEENCPHGLHFNANQEVCDWPKYAGCDPSISWSIIDTTIPQQFSFVCDNKKIGLYPYPGDCSKAVQCNNGIYVSTIKCPDNLLFNPALEVCDWPKEVDCQV